MQEVVAADVDPRDVPVGVELTASRKLCLVLDIDHTLVDCVKASEVWGWRSACMPGCALSSFAGVLGHRANRQLCL